MTVQHEMNKTHGYSVLLCGGSYPKQDPIFAPLPYRGDGGRLLHETTSRISCEDDHETTEASERDQQGSERDQNRMLAWDQNHENVRVVHATRDQNNEKAHDASVARHQNNENDYEGNPHFGETNEKQMTYREALLGLHNSELSSDF